MIGEWIEWYNNGQKKKQSSYYIGNFETDGERKKTNWSYQVGLYREWYPDGENKVMGNYDSTWVSFSSPGWWNDHKWSVNSKKIDTWTEWYENGNIERVEKYEGREIIHLQTFYENGNKKSETDYDKEGKEVNTKRWNEDGSIK